jgi:hypothetical protein
MKGGGRGLEGACFPGFDAEVARRWLAVRVRGTKKKMGLRLLARGPSYGGVAELGDRMGLVNQVGVVNWGRGSRWEHCNLKTRWSERIEDCIAFNSLRLFSAYLQTFIAKHLPLDK